MTVLLFPPSESCEQVTLDQKILRDWYQETKIEYLVPALNGGCKVTSKFMLADCHIENTDKQ